MKNISEMLHKTKVIVLSVSEVRAGFAVVQTEIAAAVSHLTHTQHTQETQTEGL